MVMRSIIATALRARGPARPTPPGGPSEAVAGWQSHAQASNRAFEIVVELLVVYLLLEFGRIATGCDVATNARCVGRYVDAGGSEPDVILSECGRLRQRCTHSLSKHVWSETTAGNHNNSNSISNSNSNRTGTGEAAATDVARINARYGGVIALCGCLFEASSEAGAPASAVPEDREIYCDLDTQRAQFFWLGIIIIFFNDWSMGTRRLRTFRPVACVASVAYLVMLGLAFDPDADVFGTLRSCSNSVEYVLKADMLRQIAYAAAMLFVPLVLVEMLHWWAAAEKGAAEKEPRAPRQPGHASAGQLPVSAPFGPPPSRCPLWPARRKGSATLAGPPPLSTRPPAHEKCKASPAVTRRATVASVTAPQWPVGGPLSRHGRGPHRMGASWHGRRSDVDPSAGRRASQILFLTEPLTATNVWTTQSKRGAPRESSLDCGLNPGPGVGSTEIETETSAVG